MEAWNHNISPGLKKARWTVLLQYSSRTDERLRWINPDYVDMKGFILWSKGIWGDDFKRAHRWETANGCYGQQITPIWWPITSWTMATVTTVHQCNLLSTDLHALSYAKHLETWCCAPLKTVKSHFYLSKTYVFSLILFSKRIKKITLVW